MTPGGVDDVGLYLQVVAQEVGGARVIGEYPADFRSRQEHVSRPLGGEESIDGLLIAEFQLLAVSQQQLVESLGLETSDDRRTHQPAMAGNIDCRVLVHSRGRKVLLSWKSINNLLVLAPCDNTTTPYTEPI